MSPTEVKTASYCADELTQTASYCFALLSRTTGRKHKHAAGAPAGAPAIAAGGAPSGAQGSAPRSAASNATLARKRRAQRFQRLHINTTQFERDGYVMVEDVFSAKEIGALREQILARLHEGTKFGPKVLRPFDPGMTIPDFMRRPQFKFMHHLPSNPALLHVLRRIFRSVLPKPTLKKHGFKFCSHNDIGIDRIVSWHKDKLNDEYARYQSLPLWGGPELDGGHKIVKALIYLQDHEEDDDAITIVPGSFATPSYDTRGARTLRPSKGSVIIMEQRSTHRGRTNPFRGLFSRKPRVLISLGYGLNNLYTAQFEHGTRLRQAHQCDAKCTLHLQPSASWQVVDAWKPTP